MNIISASIKGDWGDTKKFLTRARRMDISKILDKYGPLGVQALRNATPKDTGKTSQSWSYEVQNSSRKKNVSLVWKNSNVVDHVNIALIIQYGHGTKSGVYVQGIDYINPALSRIFSEIADEVWKEVTEL